jgi:hypothetical protein
LNTILADIRNAGSQRSADLIQGSVFGNHHEPHRIRRTTAALCRRSYATSNFGYSRRDIHPQSCFK